MGILPLQFEEGTTRKTLNLTGRERVSIALNETLKPRSVIEAIITREDGSKLQVPVVCRIDTANELEYYKNGGILQYVLRQIK